MNAMIWKLTSDGYEEFVRQRRVAAVHFDADWDARYRSITRRRMSEAADVLGVHVNFGEVDWDREIELAKSLRIINLPTVVYYLDGNPAAVSIGAEQNVLGRLERVLKGQFIGRGDGTLMVSPYPNFWCR